MRNFLLKWILMVVALVLSSIVTSLLRPGFAVSTGSLEAVLKLFVGVAVLTLLNATLGRIIKFIAIPLNCLTLGLVSLVINAIIFMIAGNLELGFKVTDFLSAFIGSLLFSLFSSVLNQFMPDSKKS